jgi:hypothetical protein
MRYDSEKVVTCITFWECKMCASHHAQQYFTSLSLWSDFYSFFYPRSFPPPPFFDSLARRSPPFSNLITTYLSLPLIISVPISHHLPTHNHPPVLIPYSLTTMVAARSIPQNRRHSPADPFDAVLHPPPDETPAQREARILAEQRAKQVNDAIDEQLRVERAELKKNQPDVKVLLLGQSESGKSTTLKRRYPIVVLWLCNPPNDRMYMP